VSLLARVVPDASAAFTAAAQSIADSPCQPTLSDSPHKTVLFNTTLLVHTIDQEDVVIAGCKEQDMLCGVSDHSWPLPLADLQEMIVGTAYTMPTRCGNSNQFNVCLHIDTTADSNKEGQPLVTTSYKDSESKF
jgi:hypothetical protein